MKHRLVFRVYKKVREERKWQRKENAVCCFRSAVCHLNMVSDALTKKAYEFVDALKAAGQSYWQILPLGPTSYGDSPYQSFSTFAGNPYFISLEELIKEGV